jgi:methionyl-tRNA formyltransferase
MSRSFAAYGLNAGRRPHSAPPPRCINITPRCCPGGAARLRADQAILAGDATTSVTIMLGIAKGLDTGPMLSPEATPISHKTTERELTAELSDDGARG